MGATPPLTAYSAPQKRNPIAAAVARRTRAREPARAGESAAAPRRRRRATGGPGGGRPRLGATVTRRARVGERGKRETDHMDHLTTDAARRERWYAAHVRPRYIEVVRDPGEDCRAPDSPSRPAPAPRSDCLDEGHIVGIPASLLVVAGDDGADDAANTRRGAVSLRRSLAEYGFAVVTGALSPAECDKALDLAWDYLEGASCAERTAQRPPLANDADAPPPVRRCDPATLSSPFFPAAVEGGILPFYGSGHAAFSWHLRDSAAVQAAFAAVHGVARRELATSLDGLVLWRAGRAHRTDAGWFHVDQNPRTKPGFAAVQGLVNLLPTTPATGGNVLVARSHALFPDHYTGDGEGPEGFRDFYRARLDEVRGDDWLEIDPRDARLLEARNVATCLLGAGDLLLWDSRVAHCSCPGREEDAAAARDAARPPGLIRAAGLVAMMPRRAVAAGARRERIRAVREARTLTHWVDKAAPLGEERRDKAALEKRRVALLRGIRPDVLLGWEDLSESQRRLIG